jgi:multimeric flavodoxin WrbA
MTAQIIFHSAHGHIYKMAKAIEQGVRDVEGADASLYRVPELGPDDTVAAKAGFGHVPIGHVLSLKACNGQLVFSERRP